MMLDKAEISKVPSQKRLGVTLYRNMAYDSHVDDLCKKLSKHVQAPIWFTDPCLLRDCLIPKLQV